MPEYPRTWRNLTFVLAASLAGCAAYERAEIMIDPRPARATGRRLELRDGRRDRPAPREPLRLALGAAAPTDRAALALIGLALQRVATVGSVRSIIEGIEHFSHAEGPRFVVHLARGDARRRETWLIDRAWALRKLDGGAVLVWQGELGPVVQTLSLVLPPATGAPAPRASAASFLPPSRRR